MKNKFLILLSLIALSSCEITTNNQKSDKTSNTESISYSEIVSEIESVSSEEVSLSEETSSLEESSKISESSEEISSSGTSVDVSENEYYKSLVKRDDIHYSTPLVNDINHQCRKLEIFQINDTHGAFYDDSSNSGISRVCNGIKSLTQDPYAVVKIANGDLMQGSAFSNLLIGEPAIAALNEMDFDCFVIGNHEFDWGFDALATYKDGDLSNGELNCPFLGANILDSNNKMPSFVEPYTIVNKGDVKVGIIGMIGDGLENAISKKALGGYHFSSTVECAKKYCKILDEEENCDIIIISVHDHDEYYNNAYAKNCKVDAIINAHDHRYIEETVTRTDGKVIPVIESNTKNITFGRILLNLNSNKEYDSYSMSHYYADNYSEDSNMKSIIDVYYKVVETYQTKKLAYRSYYTSKQQVATEVNTYIANKYDADIVFVNTGGVRDSLNAGNITVGNIYEIFPFENELYLTYLTGSEVKSMFNGISEYYYYNEKGVCYGSGIDLDDLDLTATYKVITNDYVATKDYMTPYFNQAHGLVITSDYIRDCAIEYYESL